MAYQSCLPRIAFSPRLHTSYHSYFNPITVSCPSTLPTLHFDGWIFVWKFRPKNKSKNPCYHTCLCQNPNQGLHKCIHNISALVANTWHTMPCLQACLLAFPSTGCIHWTENASYMPETFGISNWGTFMEISV